jgi:Caudovirus prohead serine protease
VASPDSPRGADLREAVRRGDLSGASFKFRVKPDGESWSGERRTIHQVDQLLDIALAVNPAYREARVELRTTPEAKEAPMSEQTAPEAATNGGAVATPEAPPAPEPETEERTERPAGTLRVTDRSVGERPRAAPSTAPSSTRAGSRARAPPSPGPSSTARVSSVP